MTSHSIACRTISLSARLIAAVASLFVIVGAGGRLQAQVVGRYVRIEAPASPRMGLTEVEVYSGNANTLSAKGAAQKLTGTGPKGADLAGAAQKHGRLLFDGRKEGASLTCDAAYEVNPWVEIDLGTAQPIERVVVTNAGAQHMDRHWRLVSILDADRRVVFARAFDAHVPEWIKSEWVFVPQAEKGGLIGRLVETGKHQWVLLADLLPPIARPLPKNASVRREAFARRDSAASIERLAKRHFAQLDLARPEFAQARAKFEAGDFAGALDAWRDQFLRKVQATAILNEHIFPRRHYAGEADDLLNNVLVQLTDGQALPWKIEPGLIDWGYYTPSTGGHRAAHDATLTAARENVLLNGLPRALLTEYACTGDERYLARWAELSDDWGLHVQHDTDAAAEDVRDYFAKETVQHFNFFCYELQVALQERPELAQKLPAATLARLLQPVLDEYGPAYWFVCRRTAFNHSFNALNAAYTTARLLDDFHAGQRLARENRQHWERIFTFNITRDGTMIEIGDEGHLDMHLRLGVLYNQMVQDRPEWFTPQFRAQFAESQYESARYLVRHLTPNGLGHRYAIGDQFERVWAATDDFCRIGKMVPRERISLKPVFHEPEMRAIVEAVFGRARDRAMLSPQRQKAYDAVAEFYGQTSAREPTVFSDWMPYAGLHYLRRDWNPDASFMHILSQPTGGAEANGRKWNTEFRYWDYGVPLLVAAPVCIDGREQNPDFGRQTYKPGSKTERLTAASQQPIPARWHSSPRFDLAETWFEGGYQRVKFDLRTREWAAERNQFVTPNAKAERSIIQVRPARAFIVTDRVTVADDKPRDFGIDYEFWSAGSEQVVAVAATGKLLQSATDHPGVTLRHFSGIPTRYTVSDSTREVSHQKAEPFGQHSTADSQSADAPYSSSFSKSKVRTDLFEQPFTLRGSSVSAKSSDGMHLVTLIAPQRDKTSEPVRSVEELSNATVAGFSAQFATGKLVWLACKNGAQELSAGPVKAVATGLLWWEDAIEAAQSGGLVLDASSLSVSGKPQTPPAGDLEFAISNGELSDVRPIRRPLSVPVIGPAERVFTESCQVTITSATPEAEIHYTLDETEPTRNSPQYTKPIVVSESTSVRARAFRPGVTEVPFSSSGIDASAVSYGRFEKQAFLPVAEAPQRLVPGLAFDYFEDSWLRLFSHLGQIDDVLQVRSHGHSAAVLDVSMRKTNGPFGVRYAGYLRVPADGVYTFHAPEEFVRPIAEPGYDLRVFVDQKEWDLSQQWHGLGNWSIPLRRGLHRFVVTFADARNKDRQVSPAHLWRSYPTPWVVWKGNVPRLEISGPGISRKAIPAEWLFSTDSRHAEAKAGARAANRADGAGE